MNAIGPQPCAPDDIFVPAENYRSKDVAAREKEHLWPRVWQMVCREHDIAKKGQFVRYDILDDSLLVVRTGDGADDIAAFYNVCQHRGRLLVEESRGQLGSTISCRFHGWQYAQDGTLKHAYQEQEWADCPAFDKQALSIPRVQVARWGGWVWINQDAEAEPLDTWLGSAKTALDPFDLAALRPLWWKTLLAPVNWKIVAEAFNEGYHSGATHVLGVDYWGLRSPTGADGNHACFFSEPHGFTRYRDAGGKWKMPGSVAENLWANNLHLANTLGAMTLEPARAASERVLALPEDTPPGEVIQNFYAWNREEIEKTGAAWPADMTMEIWLTSATDWHLFPNSIVLPTLDGALWYRVRPSPTDPDHCIFDIWSFGRFAPGAEPQVENEVFDGFDAFVGQCPFLEEDFSNMASVQAGVRSRGFRGAMLNPEQEGSIAHFHKMLERFGG